MRKLLGGGRWTVVLALAGIAAFAWPAGAEQGSRGGGEPTLSVEGPSEPVVADWPFSVATAWSTEAPQALSVVLLRAASCGVNLPRGCGATRTGSSSSTRRPSPGPDDAWTRATSRRPAAISSAVICRAGTRPRRRTSSSRPRGGSRSPRIPTVARRRAAREPSAEASAVRARSRACGPTTSPAVRRGRWRVAGVEPVRGPLGWATTAAAAAVRARLARHPEAGG
jgi:hypothetical protein